MADTVWNDRPAELLIVLEDGPDLLEAARDAERRLKYRELLKIAEGVRQVIWAKFSAFDEKAMAPWLVMSCIDGGFWRLHTDDLSTRASIARNFNGVKASES